MITARQMTQGFIGTSGGTNLTFGSAPLAGSLLLAVVRCGVTRTPVLPTGWTALRSDVDAYAKQVIHYKIATGSETGYQLGIGVTGEYVCAIVMEYAGVDTAAPINAHDAIYPTTSAATSVTAPSLTTGMVSGFLVCAFGVTMDGGAGNIFGTPSGMTERAEQSCATTPNPNYRIALDDQYVAGSPTGSRTSTLGLAVSGGWYGVTGQSVLLKIANTAPLAPTITGPAGGAIIDRTVTQRLSWTFSDPEPSDSQSKFDLQYRPVGAGSWTTVTQTTPNPFCDIAAGTFSAGNYEWQVRTYDQAGAVGPWSASAFFTASNPPTVPTITAPVSGGTIPTTTATLTWSYTSQTDYQVRKVADSGGSPDTSTVYYDSGDVVDGSARSAALTFPVNGRYEHLQLRVKSGGLWSSWTSIRVLVSYTRPAAPTLNPVAVPSLGLIDLAITNPNVNLMPTDAGASFEDGTTGSWTYGPNTSGVANVGTGAVDGSHALEFTRANSTPGNNFIGLGISPLLTPGQTYTASATVSSDGPCSVNILVDALARNYGDTVALTGSNQGRIKVTFVAGSSANTLLITDDPSGGASTSGRKIRVDAIKVEPGGTATPFCLPSAPAPTSVDLYRRVAAGRNLIPTDEMASFEGGTIGGLAGNGVPGAWVNAASSITSDGRGMFGRRAVKTVTDGTLPSQGLTTNGVVPAVVGKSYVASAWVYSGAAQTLRIVLGTDSGTQVQSADFVVPVRTLVRLVVPITMTVNGYLSLGVCTPGNSAQTWWTDGLQIEAGTVPGPFVLPSKAPAALRIAAGLPPNGRYFDRSVTSGVDYQYMARAIAGTGTTADGDWT